MPQRPRAEAKRFILHIYISMAKAKSGGTRSYLRGRIANDVYSIGKDSKGKKQQVVRSLAETVSNPQTIAQMRGRMIMSTVMQAVSGLTGLVDHSFDNVPNGQPSISEFIRRNYALVKADVAAHPASGNKFALNKYQKKGALPGAYVVSAGAAVVPSNVLTNLSAGGNIAIILTGENITAKQVRDAFGVTKDDFLTSVVIESQKGVHFFRVQLNFDLADDTVITESNIRQLLIVDNPMGEDLTYYGASGNFGVGFNTLNGEAYGIIFSKKVDAGYEHSNTTLTATATTGTSSDVVLPTYPEGSQRFLNGGEL